MMEPASWRLGGNPWVFFSSDVPRWRPRDGWKIYNLPWKLTAIPGITVMLGRCNISFLFSGNMLNFRGGGRYLKWYVQERGAMFLGNWRGCWMNCVCVWWNLVDVKWLKVTHSKNQENPSTEKKTHTQKRIKRCNPKNPKTYIFQLQNLLVNGSIFVGRPTSLRRIRTWTSWESFSSCSESSHCFFFRRVDSRSTIQISILPGSGMV